MGRRVVEYKRTFSRRLAAAGCALLVSLGGALAQSGGDDHKNQDQNKPPANAQQQPANDANSNKETPRKPDEFVEAQQVINGPAGNPECVWLGRRVVVLMWRDDLDTAFRHLDLYDRFGCPGGHIQAAFRCLVRVGGIDPKVPESLSSKVHACWINPNAQAQASAAPTPSQGNNANGNANNSQPAPAPAPAPSNGPAK